MRLLRILGLLCRASLLMLLSLVPAVVGWALIGAMASPSNRRAAVLLHVPYIFAVRWCIPTLSALFVMVERDGLPVLNLHLSLVRWCEIACCVTSARRVALWWGHGFVEAEERTVGPAVCVYTAGVSGDVFDRWRSHGYGDHWCLAYSRFNPVEWRPYVPTPEPWGSPWR